MGCLLEVHADETRLVARMAEDIRRGLTARPRQLPPKYFYDEAGSVLFERITELPEYYLTRAEDGILRDIAGDLMGRLAPRDIVELGPGSCRKVRWLLEALGNGRGIRYVAMDVGREGLAQAIGTLAAEYPRMHLHAVVADLGPAPVWRPRSTRARDGFPPSSVWTSGGRRTRRAPTRWLVRHRSRRSSARSRPGTRWRWWTIRSSPGSRCARC